MTHIHSVKSAGAQIITDKDWHFAIVEQIEGSVAHFQRYLLCVIVKWQVYYVSLSKLLTNSV